MPDNLKANAKFEEAASVEMAHFDPPISAYFQETLLKKYVLLSVCAIWGQRYLDNPVSQASWLGA